MQVKEIFIWGKKRKKNEFRYSITITISPLVAVANQNAGFALVH